MAERARLAPPKPSRKDWPWHEVELKSVPVSVVDQGDRRLEAENYLTEGFATRLSIERRKQGWCSLAAYADVWQPSRLKGIQVAPQYGTPFLAATQLFDAYPIPRKWLSLNRTHEAGRRFVSEGTILVTCSGNVGRAILAPAVVERTLISHDILRVNPRDQKYWGWLYAYLRSQKARLMMQSEQYGHIIKHLETHHLSALPVVTPSEAQLEYFNRSSTRILELRNQANAKAEEAQRLYTEALGGDIVSNAGEMGFSVQVSQLLKSKRLRLEAAFYTPTKAEVLDRFRRFGQRVIELGQASFEAWMPGRFVRVPAPKGRELLNSSDFFEVNPDAGRMIKTPEDADSFGATVKSGWLVVSRSGQVYGLLGSVAMTNKFHEGKVASEDVIRIAPREDADMRPGFLYVALSHRQFGRPLVKALAYGSSIPHIEPSDIFEFPIVRLGPDQECAIADAAEEAARLRAEADILERQIGQEVDEFIGKFTTS